MLETYYVAVMYSLWRCSRKVSSLSLTGFLIEVFGVSISFHQPRAFSSLTPPYLEVDINYSIVKHISSFKIYMFTPLFFRSRLNQIKLSKKDLVIHFYSLM